MSSRKPFKVPAIPDIDLGFRPSSYWDARDPLSSVVQNIKGQLRREMARDFIAGQAAQVLRPIEPELLEDTLADDLRVRLGQISPEWMGGEYLPNYASSEVEIARIVLQSTTRDVYSVRARRRRKGGRITYRMVDEYDSEWNSKRKSSARPLTLQQLAQLIDSAQSDGHDNEYPLIENLVRFALGWQPGNLQAAVDFVTVESTVYPMLEEYYAKRAMAWAQWWNANMAAKSE